MTVFFFADLAPFTPVAVPYPEWIEDEGTPEEVIHPAGMTTPSTTIEPDCAERNNIITVDLVGGKVLCKCPTLDEVPAGGQGIGANTTQHTIVSPQMGDNMRAYFGLTLAQRDNMVGKTFGRAIYGLLKDKPKPEKNGDRRLVIGGLFHTEVA